MDLLIKQYEGCKLTAYPDPATGGEPYTVGYGSTLKPDGSKFKLGEEITQATADALLTDYLIKNIVPVFKKIPYQLTMNQKRAVASLCYNIGVPAFLKSKCYKAMCEKNWLEMVNNWDWYKANGKAMNGLIKRRLHEAYLYCSDI